MRGAKSFWWKALKRHVRTAARRLGERHAVGGVEDSVSPLPAAPRPDSALAPDGGAWVSAQVLSPVNGARTRLAHSIYLPRAARGSALPLVVMLHGCEQTAAELAQGTRMNQLAAREGFVVLYPQQSVNVHRHRCWHWYDRATQDGSGDTASIAAMIETIVARYRIDRSRIYAAGMSAGASMAHILGLRRPDLIAAVGLHSGVAFGAAGSATAAFTAMLLGVAGSPEAAVRDAVYDPAAFPAMPAIVIHGGRDGVVSPINGVHLARQFRALNGATERIAEPVPLGARDIPGARRREDRPCATRLLRRKKADAAGVRNTRLGACMERGRQRVSVPCERGTGRERTHVGVLQVAPSGDERSSARRRCHAADVEGAADLVTVVPVVADDRRIVAGRGRAKKGPERGEPIPGRELQVLKREGIEHPRR